MDPEHVCDTRAPGVAPYLHPSELARPRASLVPDAVHAADAWPAGVYRLEARTYLADGSTLYRTAVRELTAEQAETVRAIMADAPERGVAVGERPTSGGADPQ